MCLEKGYRRYLEQLSRCNDPQEKQMIFEHVNLHNVLKK